MRLLAISLLLFVQLTASYGQTRPPGTEVFIIGTIHNGNDSFNHKTLYNILVKLKPDIILNEDSKKYKRVPGLKTAALLRIAKPSIEQLALQVFSRKNKHVDILPYDTHFISRRQYLKQLNKMNTLFFGSLNSAKMTTEDSTQYADYANQHNQYYEFITTASLERINQPDIINTARLMYKKKEQSILPIALKYMNDTLLVNKLKDQLQFWVARNNFMVKQIKTYINQYTGKRIIVLTGLNHKYFLTDKLLQGKEPGFQLIELSSN